MELEDVQKFALKVCLKSWHENYVSLLAFSELTTLAHRRRHLRLILLFKLHTNAVVYPFQPYILRETNYEHRHPNKVQLTVPFGRTNFFRNSFFPKSISKWSLLSFDTSDIRSASTFVQQLRLSNL